ncbi:MAG TPA: hypothetical protein VGJ02_12090, partial [Pyrinomonadaceae bacterium]
RCSALIDTPDLNGAITLNSEATEFELFSTDAVVEFSALEVTYGFEELFERANEIPTRFAIDGGTAKVDDGSMMIKSADDGQVSAVFNVPYKNFELTANLIGSADGYGLFFIDDDGQVAAFLTVYSDERRIVFFSAGETVTVDLPEGFESEEFRQYQVVFLNGRAIAGLEGVELAELAAAADVTRVAVYAEAEATVDMIRLTAI